MTSLKTKDTKGQDQVGRMAKSNTKWEKRGERKVVKGKNSRRKTGAQLVRARGFGSTKGTKKVVDI